MAKTKKKKTAKSKTTSTSAAKTESLLANGRGKKIAGVLLLLFGFALLVAFCSYLFTHQQDQSEVFANPFNILTKNVHSGNWFGRFGAFLSHIFMHRLFGIAAFLLILPIGASGFNLLVQKPIFKATRLWLSSMLAMSLLTVVLAFLNFLIAPSSSLFWGGGIGNYLTGQNGVITTLVSPIGTAAVLIVISLIWLIVRFDLSFEFAEKWMQKFGEWSQSTSSTKSTQKEKKHFVHDDESIFEKNGIEVTKEEKSLKAVEPIIEPDSGAVNFEVDTSQQKKTKTVEENSFEVVQPVAEKTSAEPNLSFDAIESADEKIIDKDSNEGNYDPTLDLSNYKYPTLDLLEDYGGHQILMNAEELERNKNQIIETLNNYNIKISKIRATVGPTVTLYEIVPAPGVKISKIKNLQDDIALSLAALGIRIIAPIPGKGTIGIEVPNEKKETVAAKTLLASEKYRTTKMELPVCIGKNIANEIFLADLAKMPHLLMAGATGQGKSVGINMILMSLLFKKHPSQLKFVLVDPKKVELSIYNAIEKHFLAKLPNEEEAIITDVQKVVSTVNALCVEMDDRYELLKKAKVRNLKEYNQKFVKRQLNPEKGHKYMPYIVLVIDEFADLIMTAGKEVEMPIARLAQLARAIGIHLILATQRPSVNIITGTIKANFPARISFKVSSKIDSRTILDTGGADQLIGRGDMLYVHGSDAVRLQCGFVDTPEVDRVVDFIEAQQGYPDAFELPEYIDPSQVEGVDGKTFNAKDQDPLFKDAARVIVQNQMGSTSLLQRRMKLGYNRAGRLMDQLEAAGIVGPNVGSKARDVYIHTEHELEEFLSKF